MIVEDSTYSKRWRRFNSQWLLHNTVNEFLYTQDDIKNDTMLFNCDLDFARKKSEITEDIIHNLPDSWKNQELVVDTRVHMLMYGWYPCIPGWHHDDVARAKGGTNHGQPDYDNMPYESEHLSLLLNGDICPTEFLIHSSVTVGDPPNGSGPVYKHWDEDIKRLNYSQFARKAPSGTFIEFNWETFHRGTQAVESGWRYFVRFSRKTDRLKSITNEVRNQVQVYIDPMNRGW